jgi:hypothetical protein
LLDSKYIKSPMMATSRGTMVMIIRRGYRLLTRSAKP